MFQVSHILNQAGIPLESLHEKASNGTMHPASSIATIKTFNVNGTQTAQDVSKTAQ